MNISDSILRRIGSTGLVIFERDGTLLRLNNSTRDFMLGDVSNVFVQMLQQLREAGFVSALFRTQGAWTAEPTAALNSWL